MEHFRDLPPQSIDAGTSVDDVRDSLLWDEARELAALDGRAEARDGDRVLAGADAASAGDRTSQEVPNGAESLVTWDVSPDETGHRVEACEAEDEATVEADMAEQGRDDADRDLRHATQADASTA